MKETIGFYSQAQDNQLSIESAYRGLSDRLARKAHGLALFVKKHVFTGVAAVTIGSLWFISILLFFLQLAEFGW